MRIIKSQGKSVPISEKDYAKILRKFDRTKAKLSDKASLVIQQACPLCKSASPTCSSCPLATFSPHFSDHHTRPSGCLVLINRVIGESRAFYLSYSHLYWTLNDTAAEMQIDKVHKVLLKLKKVSRKEIP